MKKELKMALIFATGGVLLFAVHFAMMMYYDFEGITSLPIYIMSFIVLIKAFAAFGYLCGWVSDKNNKYVKRWMSFIIIWLALVLLLSLALFLFTTFTDSPFDYSRLMKLSAWPSVLFVGASLISYFRKDAENVEKKSLNMKLPPVAGAFLKNWIYLWFVVAYGGLTIFSCISFASVHQEFDDMEYYAEMFSCSPILGHYMTLCCLVGILQMRKRLPEIGVERIVKGKYVMRMVTMTVISLILFPYLTYVGYHWYYLVASFLYVAGTIPLAIIPLDIYIEANEQEARYITNYGRHKYFVICFMYFAIPLIAELVIGNIFYENYPSEAAVIMGTIGLLCILISRPSLRFFINQYVKD